MFFLENVYNKVERVFKGFSILLLYYKCDVFYIIFNYLIEI